MELRTHFERISLIVSVLDTLRIPCTTNKCWGGWQIQFPWTKGDVATHRGTIGATIGYVETYQFPWDCGDVTGMSPEEAAAKISNYYFEVMRTKNEE